MLTATVHKHGRKYERVVPGFPRKVKYHFYFDDLNTAVKTSKECFEVYKNIKSLFMEGDSKLGKLVFFMPGGLATSNFVCGEKRP